MLKPFTTPLPLPYYSPTIIRRLSVFPLPPRTPTEIQYGLFICVSTCTRRTEIPMNNFKFNNKICVNIKYLYMNKYLHLCLTFQLQCSGLFSYKDIPFSFLE